jgi:hypothetical protein
VGDGSWAVYRERAEVGEDSVDMFAASGEMMGGTFWRSERRECDRRSREEYFQSLGGHL